MRGFKTNELWLFEYLVRSTQDELREYVTDVLKSKYSEVVITKEYVCAVDSMLSCPVSYETL